MIDGVDHPSRELRFHKKIPALPLDAQGIERVGQGYVKQH
jgi:hypothetical protein